MAMRKNARALAGLPVESEAVVYPGNAPMPPPAPSRPRRTPPEKTGWMVRYTFDQKGGSLIPDLSGNGFHATAQGVTSIEPGKIGSGALRLTTPKSFIALNDPSMPSLDVDDDCSLALWWKTEVINDWMCLLNKQDTSDQSRGLFFMYYAPRSCYYIHLRGGCCADFPVPIEKGVWNHTVLVKEGISWRVYHNGRNVRMTASTSWPLNGDVSRNIPLSIGNDLFGEGRYFQGEIDDFILFNKALSDSEVWELFSSPLGPTEQPVKLKP